MGSVTMRCYAELSLDSDKPFWVTRKVLLEHFNQQDLLCRESNKVTSAYLKDWFCPPVGGIARFKLPTVQFIAGRTQFINGRHRTAVLLRYLEHVPIAFALATNGRELDGWPPLRPLDLNQHIDLPDLLLVESLP